MRILNDSEHRIFLSAMSRERKVCKSEDFFDYDGTNKLLDICDSIEQKINDAEPVRHGHWIELWFDEEDRLLGELPSDYKCSVCGGIVPRKTFQSGHYCPNCGAKMDEVSE